MRLLRLLILLGLGYAISGCEREPSMGELVQHMLVQTEYNTAFVNDTENVFDTYNTFVIREDTMGFVSNSSTKKYIIESDVPGFVEPVVDAIRDNFVSAGYQKVTTDDNPDFAVQVIVLQNFNYYQYLNYGYGYPGSYYYGYYNYYYPVVSTYAANYVTLLIQVVDAKNPNGANEYPIIWSAYIGDLATTGNLTGNTLEAVDQAFAQSPYIQKD